MVNGGRINKPIPAPEGNDNVLTFYWHIGQTDGHTDWGCQGQGQWLHEKCQETLWNYDIHRQIILLSVCGSSFTHGWKHASLSACLQVHSISVSLLSLPNAQPLGYFGCSIGSAASHLTSLRHGFITEPDATRMLCVCNSSRGNQLFGKLLTEV